MSESNADDSSEARCDTQSGVTAALTGIGLIVGALILAACGSPSPRSDGGLASGARLDSPSPAPTISCPAPTGFLPRWGMALTGTANGAIAFGGAVPGTVTTYTSSADTWISAAGCWQRVSSSTQPPARHDAGFGTDPHTGKQILYGGLSTLPGPYVTNLHDTWTWTGSDWQAMAAGPSIDSPTIITDSTGQLTLIGAGPRQALEVWHWVSGMWMQAASPHAPSSRTGASACYDSQLRQAVLFGGIGQDGVLRNDTWLWDGNDWLEATAAVRPPGRLGAAMTCAPHPLVFGGAGITKSLGDSWTYVGGTWVNATPAHSPEPRRDARFVTTNGHLRLIGGASDTQSVVTWEWTGVDWSSQP